MILGIDASRNRSGGAQAHLIGVLSSVDPQAIGVERIHIWSYAQLLEQIPNHPWLIKHSPASLSQGLIRQLIWQSYRLSAELRRTGCDILLTTDASTLCKYDPMVVISQDLLSYEQGIMQSYGLSGHRIRLETILRIQNWAFQRAAGVIFLTRYAGELIQQSCGKLSNVRYIPHGVDDAFRALPQRTEPLDLAVRPVQCLYVSNAAMYKHQWEVVRAIHILRNQGVNLTLKLVGGGSGEAQRLLNASIEECDPFGRYIELKPYLARRALMATFSDADVFVFASSCENLPVTLLEAMAAGLPIASSDRGPMPEVLGDAGVYFNPEHPSSIAAAVNRLIKDAPLRGRVANTARQRAALFSWQRCARETFEFVIETYRSGATNEATLSNLH